MTSSTTKTLSFTARIEKKLQEQGSHLCLGIDPPLPVQAVVQFGSLSSDPLNFLLHYGRTLLQSAKSTFVKFQSAYFEAYGQVGLQALATLCDEAKTLGYFVIMDSKRGDISTTMAAYGYSAFEVYGADAMTVNAYMGSEVLEALMPWLHNGRGVFVVWITSNPSAGAIQELQCTNAESHPESLAEHIFGYLNQYAKNAGISEAIGYVLGATKIAGLSTKLTTQILQTSLLLPGVGAQGAPIDEMMCGLLQQGRGGVVPISRGISYCSNRTWSTWNEFGQYARDRAQYFHKALRWTSPPFSKQSKNSTV